MYFVPNYDISIAKMMVSGVDPVSYTHLCKERNISAYHMKYIIDEAEVSDSMNPDECREFYKKMRNGSVPKTSQMTPYEFVTYWTDLWEKYKLPIVHIALGSGISGTYSNSLMAKNLFLEKNKEASVFIVDSTLASIGYLSLIHI